MSEEQKNSPETARTPEGREKTDKLSRRRALLAGLLGAGAVVAKTAEAAEASCACLAAPDCDAVCPNGGVPKGDGTQACACNEKAEEQLANVAYTGSYNDLKDKPYHAGSKTDGGAAVSAENATKWNNLTLRRNHNTTDTWIPVFSGDYLDYVLKSEISIGQIGEAVIYNSGKLGTTGSGKFSAGTYTAVKRDAYGRVIAVGYVQAYQRNCNCNCTCACSDSDNGCFIRANFMTQRGEVRVCDLKPGDIILGVDGEHRVVGMASNVLGHRKAVSPKGHPDVLLTDDHIILALGVPSIVDRSFYYKNKLVLKDPKSGIAGRYAETWLDDLITDNPEAFDVIEMSADTPTFTPIVDRGHWGRTVDGADVLLCPEISE